MTQTHIINGKAAALALRIQIAHEVAALKAERDIHPALAVVLIGDDPASHVYVKNKIKACKEAGITSIEKRLDVDVSEDALLAVVDELNKDASVHGILVQLPLPKHINEQRIIHAIDPKKDVDGFHPISTGELWLGEDTYAPCTPQGCMILLHSVCDNLSGKHAVIVGRSNIVGKPIAALLLAANCTVTITHSRTVDLEAELARADIVIAAVGRPEMIKGEWLKQGAIVIDVGINRTLRDGKNKLVGDVDFASCDGIVSHITPVPGGVGPMTIACLLKNTLKAAGTT